MHPAFFKQTETVFLDQWHRADPYTQKLFSWLPELQGSLGRTYCCFNFCWPEESLIAKLPRGMDTYVFHFGTEYIDWVWLHKFCKQVADSRVILISPYPGALYAEPNLTAIQIDFWPDILQWYQEEHDITPVTYDRPRKISSLANRVSQFRSYVCAYLHQTWLKEDYLLSWRGIVVKPDHLYLLDATNNPRIDPVIDYLKSTFFDLRIKPDGDFSNNPVSNLSYDWAAYTDCVINCSNESVNNSFQRTRQGPCIMPGPYLTEKTWKCLLSGTALLPVGQYKTYEYLEAQGFKFDYPWSKEFDQQSGDIDRIAGILDCLDQIKDMPLDFLQSATRESSQHNRDHILSGAYRKQGQAKNLNSIQQFIDHIQ